MEDKMPLGSFEEIVLLAVLRLNNDAYGVPIRQLVEQATGRMISIGAIYTTLDRLEGKGYVSSYMGEPTAERGGRAKKYFKIAGAGNLALNAMDEARRNMRVVGDFGTVSGVVG